MLGFHAFINKQGHGHATHGPAQFISCFGRGRSAVPPFWHAKRVRPAGRYPEYADAFPLFFILKLADSQKHPILL
jgi:hypothetical protein